MYVQCMSYVSQCVCVYVARNWDLCAQSAVYVVCVYVCMQVWMCVRVSCMCVCMQECGMYVLYVRLCTMYAGMCACVYVCMYVMYGWMDVPGYPGSFVFVCDTVVCLDDVSGDDHRQIDTRVGT